MPLYLYIVTGAYLFFLVIGLLYSHNKPLIDIKFQILAFLFYMFLLNKKDFKILPFLFIINYIVLGIYILLYLGKFPNMWHSVIVGYQGRVYGPSIISIVLISFYYLINKKNFDTKLAIAFIVALPSFVLTTNLMNLVITGILLFLLLVDLKKLFQPKIVFIIIGIGLSSYLFFTSDFAPELIKEKVPYILNPLEYPSLKIRQTDLKAAYYSENYTLREKLIGKGFGASTIIYRENLKATSWSRFYSFQEIDNGFYYLFHRGGYLLLFLFITLHIYLIFIIDSLKAKVGFISIVLITCFLSIHYFNNMFYLIIIYLIVKNKFSIRNKDLIIS